MSFNKRDSQHELYIKEVMEKIKSHNCIVQQTGIEKKLPKDFITTLLELVKDPTASFLRFQPDISGVKSRKTAFLCEVKSRITNSPNISMELEPFEKVLDLRIIGIRVFYVLPEFKVAFPEQIKMDEIHVPDRWNKEIFLEVKAKYPKIEVKHTKWSKNGSGTIYFLIKTPQIRTLLDLDAFLEQINLKKTLMDFLY